MGGWGDGGTGGRGNGIIATRSRRCLVKLLASALVSKVWTLRRRIDSDVGLSQLEEKA